jgi:hypothetical protein
MSFSRFIEHEQNRTDPNAPLYRMRTIYLPSGYYLYSQATLEDLDEMLLICGFKQKHENPQYNTVMKLFDHNNSLLKACLFQPLSEQRYGSFLSFDDREKKFSQEKPTNTTAIEYNSYVKLSTTGRRNHGKLEAIGKITSELMKLLTKQKISSLFQVPTTGGNGVYDIGYVLNNFKEIQDQL